MPYNQITKVYEIGEMDIWAILICGNVDDAWELLRRETDTGGDLDGFPDAVARWQTWMYEAAD